MICLNCRLQALRRGVCHAGIATLGADDLGVAHHSTELLITMAVEPEYGSARFDLVRVAKERPSESVARNDRQKMNVNEGQGPVLPPNPSAGLAATKRLLTGRVLRSCQDKRIEKHRCWDRWPAEISRRFARAHDTKFRPYSVPAAKSGCWPTPRK